MNRYTVSSLIGEGSFGRVYRATRKVDDQIVALKIISKVCKLFVNNKSRFKSTYFNLNSTFLFNQ